MELSGARQDVVYELLDLAVEHPVGLVEIRNQWPRELVVPILIELISTGLLAIGPERDLTGSMIASPDADALQALLHSPGSWEPPIDDWRTNSHIAVFATPPGEREYLQLAAGRLK